MNSARPLGRSNSISRASRKISPPSKKCRRPLGEANRGVRPAQSAAVLGTRAPAAVHAGDRRAAHAWDTATGTPVVYLQGGGGTLQRYLTEAVGTCGLVFGGCGSV